MITLLVIALFFQTDIEGYAAYSHRVGEAAHNRGMVLSDPGCALTDCALLGSPAWVKVKGRWVGPLTSVDCGAARDRAFLSENRRVVNIPWRLWRRLGLPDRPVRVEVSLSPPGPWPMRE